MRKMIFRAKSISTNEYVYGAYIYDEVHKKHFIIKNCMHGLTEVSVHPNTVGQLAYTLSDGTEIFENDIVKTKYQDTALVVWKDAHASFATKTIDNVIQDEILFCLKDIIEVKGSTL